jgi:hypothetical protein
VRVFVRAYTSRWERLVFLFAHDKYLKNLIVRILGTSVLLRPNIVSAQAAGAARVVFKQSSRDFFSSR